MVRSSAFIFALLVNSLALGATHTKNISVLTYNVAGLPDFLSSSNPDKNTKIISPLLNDYDIVLVQEDFFYHRDLISKATHRYKSTPDCDIYTSKTSNNKGGAHCFYSLGDGLNTLSRLKFSRFQRVAWDDCSGYFNRASDCLTPKGFSFAVHEVAPDKTIHVYNLHADAGSGKEDKKARQKNFRQLAQAIKKFSANQAVIVAGDFNSTYTEENFLREELVNVAALQDTWLTIQATAKESIDKIFYRSSKTVFIEPVSYEVEEAKFTKNGAQLSDHLAISGDFEISWDQ